MQYDLVEVAEIPKGRQNKASPALYNDIIKVFIENGYARAKVVIEGKNPDVVARRLESRVDSGISVISRGDAVYLRNNSLVDQDEGDI
jgi:hypothetical protein